MAITQEFNGDILVDGNVSSDTITAIGATINGELSANSANVSGAISAGGASISGGLSANTANINGAVTANYLNTTGNATNQTMSQLAITNAISNAITNALTRAYPVGAYYIGDSATSPAFLFGGTWQPINNRFLYASGKYSAGATGGEETHNLSINEMPNHGYHLPYGGDGTSGGSASGKYLADRAFDSYGATGRGWNQITVEYYPAGFNTGAGQAHNNMPPFLVVNMWKRIA